MTRVALLSAGVALALSLGACNRPAETANDDSAAASETATADAEAVKQAFAKFNADITAKNLDAIKAHYASDAVMILPDRKPFEGIDAIMADYQEFAADPAGKYAAGAETTEISAGGDVAYGEVNYRVSFTNPKTKAVETSDRYNLTVFKKQPDGSWKIMRDVNVPLPKAG